MLIDGERSNEGEGAEGEGAESGAGPTPAVSREEFDALMGKVGDLTKQNEGLRSDLQTERKRRRGLVSEGVQTFTENLKLSDEEKKKVEEGLNGDAAVEVMIGLVQRVVHHEWGKYVTHQTGVSELMERHPDMFDTKTGRYNPNSEKGKLWEQIAVGHPELTKNPNGVRVAMDLLEEQFEPGKSKSKAKAEDEGDGEGEGEGDGEGEGEPKPKSKPHVGDGGRKPAPKGKGPQLSKEEEAMSVRYGGKEAYSKSKGSKIIEADV